MGQQKTGLTHLMHESGKLSCRLRAERRINRIQAFSKEMPNFIYLNYSKTN